MGSAIIIILIHNLHIAEEELHSSNGIQQRKIFYSVLDSIIGFWSGISPKANLSMQLSVIQMPSTPCHSIGKLINMSIQKKKKTNAVFLLGRDLFWQQLVRTKSYELSIRALVKFCGWGTVIKATKPARWEYTLFSSLYSMHTANIVYKQFMSFIKTYKCLLWHNATHMVRNGVQGVRKTRTRKLKNFIVLCKQTKKAIVKIDTSKRFCTTGDSWNI